MPSVPVVDVASGERREASLSDAVFGVEPNRHLLYEAVRHYRARQRRGTHATKNRAKVSGGGSKPWRQKGTGRARVGSTRTPLWRKGGTVFGPTPRDHGYKLNGKVQRRALKSALSMKVKDDAVSVVTAGLDFDKPSTKALKSRLEELELLPGRVLLVASKPADELYLSARNLRGVEVRSVASLHTYDVLAARKILLFEDAAPALEEKLSR